MGWFLPACCYTSLDTSCGPVSVCHNSVSVERDGQIELVLAWRLSLTYLTLPYLEFQVSTQLRVLTDLENFSMAYRSSQHFFNLATQTWTLLV